MPARFHLTTLGCPKNAVDSDKIVASLLADGLAPAATPEDADLVVLNTCAFVEAARQESIDVDDEVPDTSPFAYVSRIEEHLAAAAQLLQELQTRLDELEARGTDLTGRSSGTPSPR